MLRLGGDAAPLGVASPIWSTSAVANVPVHVGRKADGTGLAWGHSSYGGSLSPNPATLIDLVHTSCNGGGGGTEAYACVARESGGTGCVL